MARVLLTHINSFNPHNPKSWDCCYHSHFTDMKTDAQEGMSCDSNQLGSGGAEIHRFQLQVLSDSVCTEHPPSALIPGVQTTSGQALSPHCGESLSLLPPLYGAVGVGSCKEGKVG